MMGLPFTGGISGYGGFSMSVGVLTGLEHIIQTFGQPILGFTPQFFPLSQSVSQRPPKEDEKGVSDESDNLATKKEGADVDSSESGDPSQQLLSLPAPPALPPATARVSWMTLEELLVPPVATGPP
jgi:hypothetical protein